MAEGEALGSPGTLRESDRQACLELASLPGSEFALVQGFLPVSDREPMLAFEALFRSLRDIPRSVSDPSVGIAKIAWWQQELRRAPEEGTQHPVARGMLDSGVLGSLNREAFSDYLHALVEALQEETTPTVAALQADLQRTAGQEALMIAEYDPGTGVEAGPGMEAGADMGPLRDAGVVNRLLDLMRSIGQGEPQSSWLPLDLVARHRYRPGESAPDVHHSLISDLAEAALAWCNEAIAPHTCTTPGARFIALRHAVVLRRLRDAQANPARWLSRGGRPSVGEVFACWRLARQVRRST